MRGWPFALLATLGTVVVVSVLVIVALTSSSGTSIFDLEVGDCFDLPIGDDEAADVAVEDVDVIDCGDPHEAEVVLIGALNPTRDRPYPSDDDLFAEVDARCGEIVGGAGTLEGFGVVPIAPNERSWEPFDGGFLCVALPFGGGSVTGSIAPG
jgi:hypothetical protein